MRPVRDAQPENADLPIDVTKLGIVISVRDLQQKNAESPIEVTESGI